MSNLNHDCSDLNDRLLRMDLTKHAVSWISTSLSSKSSLGKLRLNLESLLSLSYGLCQKAKELGVTATRRGIMSNTEQKEAKKKKLAATFATPSTVIGLGGSSIKAKPFSSSFLKPTLRAKNALRLAGASGGRVTCFERNWLRRDLNVVVFGLIGWLAPSSIPAINGMSLTGLFFESIGTELAHFPTPPDIASQFRLWLVTWHLGLFLCLTFGQIGFKGWTEGYFEK